MKVPEEPLFMSNPEWYYFDEKECRYRLTDEAPKEARESYVEFYSTCVYNGDMYIER